VIPLTFRVENELLFCADTLLATEIEVSNKETWDSLGTFPLPDDVPASLPIMITPQQRAAIIPKFVSLLTNDNEFALFR